MTLVPRLVLSLRSSGKEGVFSTLGACVAWNEGFLGDRFTSVPLPKAWMAFPVEGERWRQRNQDHLHHFCPSLSQPLCSLEQPKPRTEGSLSRLNCSFRHKVPHVQKKRPRGRLKETRDPSRKKRQRGGMQGRRGCCGCGKPGGRDSPAQGRGTLCSGAFRAADHAPFRGFSAPAP